MKPVQNPHDKLFKALMADMASAINFLGEFLPPEIVKLIDLTKLQRMESSFVTGELAEVFVDAVFRCPLMDSSTSQYLYICILVEHKSFPDDFTLLQVGQYLFQAYQQQIRSKGRPLELIIPLVYYHGKKRWEVPPIADLFPPYSDYLNSYLPQLKIVFQDLGLKNDDDILEMDPAFLAAALLMQRYSHDPDTLFSRFDLWIELTEAIQKNRNQFQIVVVYYLEMLKSKKANVMEKIKEYPTPVKDELMSVADQLRYEGMEQGMEQKELIAIKNMIKKGFDTEVICDVLEASKEKVETVRKNMGSS